MNFLYRLSLISVLVLIVSCHTDEGYGLAIPKANSVNYFPLTVGNQWTYHTAVSDNSGVLSESTDTLYVADSLNVYETPSYVFTPDSTTTPAPNTFLSFLSLAWLNNVDNRLILNPELPLELPLFDSPIALPAKNLIVLQQNIESGEQISSIGDTLYRTVSYQEKSIPVVLTYEITTYMGQKLEDYETDRGVFKNVSASQIKISLGIRTGYVEQNNFEFLPRQEVLSTTNYFAERTGLIESRTDIRFNYQNLGRLGISAPAQIKQYIQQQLTDYQLKKSL